MSVFGFFKKNTVKKQTGEFPSHQWSEHSLGRGERSPEHYGEPRFAQSPPPYQEDIHPYPPHPQGPHPHEQEQRLYAAPPAPTGQAPYASRGQDPYARYQESPYPQEPSIPQQPHLQYQRPSQNHPQHPVAPEEPSLNFSAGRHNPPQGFSQDPYHGGQPPLHDIPANHPQRGPDLRGLGFWDKPRQEKREDTYDSQSHYPSPPRYDNRFSEEEEESESQPLRFVLALGILIIFAALAWLVFKWSTQSVSTTPPHIQADKNPFKVRPDNPGGMIVPHQDKLVYDRMGRSEASAPEAAPMERLLPPPEQPFHPQHIQQPPTPEEGGYGASQGYPTPASQTGQAQAPYPPQQGGYPQGNVQVQQQAFEASQPPLAYHETYQEPQGNYGPPPSQQPMQHPQTVQPYPPQGAGYPQPPAPTAQPSYAPQEHPQSSHVEEGLFPPQQQGHQEQQNVHLQEPSYTAPQNQQRRSITPPHRPAPAPQKTATPQQGLATGFFPSAPASSPRHPSQQPKPSVTPQQPRSQAPAAPSGPYKAKLASVATRTDAEKEWERLRITYREHFQETQKSIVERTSHGRKYFVVYALNVQGQEQAKNLCQAVGAGCSYEKQ